MKFYILAIFVFFLYSCSTEVSKPAIEVKEENVDFFYTLKQAEDEFGIKMHESTDSAFQKIKKMAEDVDSYFPYKEPSYSLYLQFRPTHRVCISSYLNYKTSRKVRSFEVSHFDIIGKPKSEYISDLVNLYGPYKYLFRKDSEKNELEYSERYFWPAEHGGVELEYFQRKKRKGNNTEFTCTVKLMDHGTYIKDIKYLSSNSDFKELKTELKFKGFPLFKAAQEDDGNLYITLDKIESKFGIRLNSDAEPAFKVLRQVDGYRKPRTSNEETRIYLEDDKNYRFGFHASSRWHKDKKIHQISVNHSKDLQVSRKDFLAKLKKIYGDFTHAHLYEYETYFSAGYLWVFPNGCGLKYEYSTSPGLSSPHRLSFLTNYACWNEYHAHLNFDSKNKTSYR